MSAPSANLPILLPPIRSYTRLYFVRSSAGSQTFPNFPFLGVEFPPKNHQLVPIAKYTLHKTKSIISVSQQKSNEYTGRIDNFLRISLVEKTSRPVKIFSFLWWRCGDVTIKFRPSVSCTLFLWWTNKLLSYKFVWKSQCGSLLHEAV